MTFVAVMIIVCQRKIVCFALRNLQRYCIPRLTYNEVSFWYVTLFSLGDFEIKSQNNMASILDEIYIQSRSSDKTRLFHKYFG
jgi:hypothetical protein